MLTLYYYEGLTLAEIGEILGVTESRVCQIHTKAVLQLRSRMADGAERELGAEPPAARRPSAGATGCGTSRVGSRTPAAGH